MGESFASSGSPITLPPPHLLFVQRSGLAGAFSMDKMLWEEYEKTDLKVTAGQRGERREKEKESLVITALPLHLKLPPCLAPAEMKKGGNAEM